MDITQIVTDLKAEVARIENAIAALVGFGGTSSPRRGRPPKSQVSQRAPAKSKMSPAARKKIGLAMKLAWAKRKGESAPTKAAVPAKKTTVRRPMSLAMKKKMSALMKKRWAQTKKAGSTSL